MEYVNDFDLNLNCARYRTYDPTIGRWYQIDPKAEDFYSLAPYNNNENNPISNADPNGDCPWCLRVLVGAAAGAAWEYGSQVVSNVSEGKGWNSFTDVDGKEIGKSAVFAGVGVGVASKLLKVKKAKDAIDKVQKLDKVKKAKELKRLGKAKKSFEKLINEHKQKVKDYLKNPDKYDNKELLKKASPKQRKKIIEGRVKALEKQIKKQEGELQKVNDKINNLNSNN